MKRRVIVLAVCAACAELSLAATEPTQGDFGGIGLLQTPTARMAPAGSFGLNLSRVAPYGRYAVIVQPFDWLEAIYRYTSVSSRLYGAEALSGDQSYKDKSFDLKLRLWEESRWLPEIAVGARDIGGTGLFASEYIVANKRWEDFDFSLGLGWGYLGKQAHFDNPLGWLDDRFRRRPAVDNAAVGDIDLDSYFRGPVALFGGVQWQTPWAPLQLKLEYDGNDYRNEFGGPGVKQDSPLNLGATYRLNSWLTLHAGWERGNTAMLALTMQTDVGGRTPSPPKVSDPAPEAVRPDAARPAGSPDWADVAKRIEDSAGYRVQRIAQREREVVVYGEQTRFFHAPVGVGRGARVLDNAAGPEVDWLTVSESRDGLPLTETSVKRDTFRKALQDDVPLDTLRRSTEQVEPRPRQETTLYEPEDQDRLTYGASVGYRQNLGGPDSFILYQFSANLNAEYQFEPGTWLAGTISGNLHNNFDKFRYTAPSRLPRVRTFLREYWTSSDVTLPLLQLNHARRLGEGLYGIVYGGYMEVMFAGVGGELLYRPLNEPWAIGLDLNWVKQRDFDVGFGLRDYDVLTGHVSGYYRGIPNVLVTASAGRYLAGDYGVTLDLAREFTNGVRFGAWATLTNVSKEEYGEGSFDKGFYISIPFDEMATRSTLRRANIAIAPLTRDGGARLARDWRLFDLTEGRNVDFFHQNFGRIKD